MKRRWLAGLLVAALVGPVMAAAPASIPFDRARSQASFSVQLLIMPSTEGRFERAEGELQSLRDRRWRVRVAIDARRIVFAGPDWLGRSTRSEKFLDVDNHPEIRFVSEPFTTELLTTGGDLAGRLDLRGQSREVVFQLQPSACERPGRDCAIRVAGEVSRRDFGMTAYRLTVRDRVGFDFAVFLAGDLP